MTFYNHILGTLVLKNGRLLIGSIDQNLNSDENDLLLYLNKDVEQMLFGLIKGFDAGHPFRHQMIVINAHVVDSQEFNFISEFDLIIIRESIRYYVVGSVSQSRSTGEIACDYFKSKFNDLKQIAGNITIEDDVKVVEEKRSPMIIDCGVFRTLSKALLSGRSDTSSKLEMNGVVFIENESNKATTILFNYGSWLIGFSSLDLTKVPTI